jgi:hypothetical protein
MKPITAGAQDCRSGSIHVQDLSPAVHEDATDRTKT